MSTLPPGPPSLPHDLLEVAGAGALVCDVEPPAWVTEALREAPFVVVRRAERRGELLPVGVRGRERSARFAAWLPAARVASRTRPEDLVPRLGRPGRQLRAFVQLACLDEIDARLAPLGLVWGPVGSAGFELATGTPCLGDASDVDVVLRVPRALRLATARGLCAAFAAMPCRIDAQIETPAGAISLDEYARHEARVVLRTVRGPELVPHPWPRG